MEEWRMIEEFPLYDVSSLGRVRRARGQANGVSLGRVLRTFTNGREYLVVGLADGKGNYFQRNVHRLVGEAFFGPLPEGMVTRHLDGDPTNNNVNNLKYGTQAENNRDTVDHGRNYMARKTHCAKGHLLSGETYAKVSGGRQRFCRACKRDRERTYARVRDRLSKGRMLSEEDQAYFDRKYGDGPWPSWLPGDWERPWTRSCGT